MSMIRELQDAELAVMREHCPSHFHLSRGSLIGSVVHFAVVLGGAPFDTPPMKIWNHEWIARVTLDSFYGWGMNYLWRRPEFSCHGWNRADAWPSYDGNNGMTGGDIRSVSMDHRRAMTLVRASVHKDSHLVTDQAQHYKNPPVAKHSTVDHSKYEWKRGEAYTNTLEGFFSVLKRGLVGIYQHVDKKHLNRYLAEFDFRQNTRQKLGIDDVTRTKLAIRGMAGKRLTYMDSFA